MFDTAILTLASLFSGFVDAIVGGGGLVLVPALFGIYPNAAPATLFGTNKGAAVWGTGWATLQYARRVRLPWDALLPAAGAALIGSFIGAWTVTLIAPTGLRRALPFILLAVLIYTLARKELGRAHAPLHRGRTQAALASAIGAAIGFYDGFFGPGTGTFLIIGFVVLLHLTLQEASANAKVVNFASNLAAMIFFTVKGLVIWKVSIPMAAGQFIGGTIGAHLAVKGGDTLVRRVVLLVVLALVTRLGYELMHTT